MIILGAVLALVGWFIGFAILMYLGVLLILLGVLFIVLAHAGRPVRGRSHWY